MNTAHAWPAPSPWVQRWSHLIAPGHTVLDVACGSGRHTHWFAERGGIVTAIDRDAQATQHLQAQPRVNLVLADIEGQAWPIGGQTFDAVIVTNYLWRPLMPTLLASLAPGGVLIYETFGIGQAQWGKPSNPLFLLQSGELLALCRGLRVVAYEDGHLDHPPRVVQRIVATRANAPSNPAATYPLTAPSLSADR